MASTRRLPYARLRLAGESIAPLEVSRWSLSSAGRVESAELDAHLRWLLDQLEPRAAELRRIQEAGAGAELVCYCPGDEELPVPSETLGRCATLSLPLVAEDFRDVQAEGA